VLHPQQWKTVTWILLQIARRIAAHLVTIGMSGRKIFATVKAILLDKMDLHCTATGRASLTLPETA
jgi:hypothetical protein